MAHRAGAVRKFFAEASRRRAPPLLWPGLAALAVFLAIVAFILAPEPPDPLDRLAPVRARLDAAEAAGDWDAAIRGCDEALALLEETDHAGLRADLRAQRKQLLRRRARDAEAESAWRGFHAEVEAVLALSPEKRHRAAQRLIQGRALGPPYDGTRASEKFRADLERLKSIPPPLEWTWTEVRRRFDEAFAAGRFAEALREVDAFLERGPNAEERAYALERRARVLAARGARNP
jgi:tetratricopeptide (TPR) repeat protein